MKPIDPPLLIAKPCPASWTDMKGDDKRRFCEQCNLHVHNLSAMNDRERTDFVEKNGTTECIAYVPLPDGRIVVPSAWDRVGEFFRPLRHHARAALLLLFPFLGSVFAADPAPSFVVPGEPTVPTTPKHRKGQVTPDGKVLLGDAVAPTPKQSKAPTAPGGPAKPGTPVVPEAGKPIDPKHVVMGMVAAPQKADDVVVKEATTFSVGGIGVAGIIAPAETALRRIVEAKDATAQLERLVKDATPAGKLYALLGLKLLKSESFDAAAEPLLKDKHEVGTFAGCVGGRSSVAEITTAIKAGTYSK